MRTFILIGSFLAALAVVEGEATEQNAAKVQIALSASTSAGLVIGTVFIGMIVFAVSMIHGIRISEAPSNACETS